MIYDLNIPWSPSLCPTDLDQTLRFAHTLGYDVVALNHTLSYPIAANITSPISLPPPSQNPQSKPASQPQNPTTLRRATVTIAEPSHNHRLPTVAAAYDLLAVRPVTERAFAAACLTIDPPPALISLDLAQHFPFHFRPTACMAAVRKGTRFELVYAPLLLAAGSGEEARRARATCIANAMALVRATRGRGIVLSSGARGALGLRAPADVVNLAAVVWGLGPEHGTAALGATPRSVVVNEGVRRRGYRGVVDIVQTAGGTGGGGDEAMGGKRRRRGAAEGQANRDGDRMDMNDEMDGNENAGNNKNSITAKHGDDKKRIEWERRDGKSDSTSQTKQQKKAKKNPS